MFIVYGASLGVTDSWWWNNIFDSVLNKGSELIIYSHSITDKAIVKSRFVDACQNSCSDADRDAVCDRIYVAPIIEGKTVMLSMNGLSEAKA